MNSLLWQLLLAIDDGQKRERKIIIRYSIFMVL